jgi:hypothetical protein
LKRLRERCGKKRTRFAHVRSAVSTDGDNGRARIFVVRAFDVAGSGFAINCECGVRGLNN